MASAIRLIPFGYIAATVPVDEAHAAQETGLSIFSEPLLDTALYTVSTNKSTLAWIDLPRLNPPALSHIVIRVPIFISESAGLTQAPTSFQCDCYVLNQTLGQSPGTIQMCLAQLSSVTDDCSDDCMAWSRPRAWLFRIIHLYCHTY